MGHIEDCTTVGAGLELCKRNNQDLAFVIWG